MTAAGESLQSEVGGTHTCVRAVRVVSVCGDVVVVDVVVVVVVVVTVQWGAKMMQRTHARNVEAWKDTAQRHQHHNSGLGQLGTWRDTGVTMCDTM